MWYNDAQSIKMSENISPKPEVIVMSVGGSLIYNEEGLNIPFLKSLNKFIRNNLINRKFFLVIGGGKISRRYQHAAKSIIGNILDTDIDWLGIHSTHLNAHLVRTIFHDIASPRIIENYDKTNIDDSSSVIIAAGWKPGWSTDYCATLIARDHQAKTIFNLTNIDWVYEEDPNKNVDAKPIKMMDWESYCAMVGDKWKPGLNVPFDPIASKLAKEIGATVIIANGHNFKNLTHILYGGAYKGTTIMPTLPSSHEFKEFENSHTKIKGIKISNSKIKLMSEKLINRYRALWIRFAIGPKKVLDIGCGNGLLVRYLRELGIDAIGIDVDEKSIQNASKEVRPFLFTGEVTELPFEDELFDLVVTFDLFEHLPRTILQEAVTESTRVGSRYILHKIFTLENLWRLTFHHHDPSQVSVLHHNFWINLFENLEGITFAKKNIFHLPLFLESIFLLQKKSSS